MDVLKAMSVEEEEEEECSQRIHSGNSAGESREREESGNTEASTLRHLRSRKAVCMKRASCCFRVSCELTCVRCLHRCLLPAGKRVWRSLQMESAARTSRRKSR